MSDDPLARLQVLGARLEQLEADRKEAMAEVRAIVREHRDDVPIRQMGIAAGLTRKTVYKMLEDT